MTSSSITAKASPTIIFQHKIRLSFLNYAAGVANRTAETPPLAKIRITQMKLYTDNIYKRSNSVLTRWKEKRNLKQEGVLF
jgi:hypothetical protein